MYRHPCPTSGIACRFSVLIPLLALTVGGCLQGEPASGLQPATNPILWADVPDVSILRAGDTWYMASTTMHMNPGLPILRSRDLVSWELVSYAYETLVDNDRTRLENGASAYGAGSWAPSLRFHDGTFYATTFSSTSGKTHVFSTTNIESGDWDEYAFSPSLHDHSLWFEEDGRVFMIWGAGEISIIELNPGARGIKPGAERQVIIPNASLVAGENIGLPAEGSQVVKVNGKYYLFNIVWPRGGMRTVLVHRADSLFGPWEGRVAFEDRGIAQGGLIDTPDGMWYACLFRDYGAVGRTPWLVPVTWEDGWPVIGVEGVAPDTLPIAAPANSLAGIVTSDEFDRMPGEASFHLAWQWNHNPVKEGWSLTERPGFLRLRTVRRDENVLEARNMLTQRTFGPESSATVLLDAGGLLDGDCAGIIALQKHYGWVGVERAGEALHLVVEQQVDAEPTRVASTPLSPGTTTVFLRIACDFRDRADTATFHYSLDNNDWKEVGQTLRMRYTLPHFMGYRFGLFLYGKRQVGGHADFDSYHISGR
jgi:beta-xylosidase